MKLNNFFIDELGSASPKASNSTLYILSGIMVTHQNKDELKIKADQIKFKYWGRTDIVFHSREMGRAEGDFDILKNAQTKSNFEKDLLKFLNNGVFNLFATIVDKNKIPKNWIDKTIYKKTADSLIKNFILALLAQTSIKGRLVVESATAEKDFYYHKAAGYYLSNGIKELGITYNDVQEVLTEVSFVSKKNEDIEEQIADLLAYGIRLKYEKRKQTSLSDYEKRIINVVSNKLFTVNPNTGSKKKKFYSQINSFKILP